MITAGTLLCYQYAVQQGFNEAHTRTMVFTVLITANIFFGAGYTYVSSNRLLVVGQELNHSPVTHDVFNYQYGVEVSGRSFRISYTVNATSRQRDDIEGHRYGSITLAFRII